MDAYTVDAIVVLPLARVLGFVGLLWGMLVVSTPSFADLFDLPAPGLLELRVVLFPSPLYGLLVGVFTAIVYDVATDLVGGVVLEQSVHESP